MHAQIKEIDKIAKESPGDGGAEIADYMK